MMYHKVLNVQQFGHLTAVTWLQRSVVIVMVRRENIIPSFHATWGHLNGSY